MRKFYLLILIFVLHFGNAGAQANLVINEGAYIVLSGSSPNTAYLVIENSATTAISRTGATPKWIITSDEYGKVKWNVSSALTGSAYVFPFGYSSTDYLPFRFEVTVAGTGAGYVTGSSWYTSANATLPSGTSWCPAINEDNVLDRFWVIDLSGYTGNPTAKVRFSYSTATDYTADGGTFGETNLLAQRWGSGSPCQWEAPTGTYTAGSPNYVEVTTANFSPWALSNRSTPLPIGLISFSGECLSDKIKIYWETAAEINNDFFTVERSNDGENFEAIGILDGAGSSHETHQYFFTESPTSNLQNQVYYYRLKQTDLDGAFDYSATISVNSCDNKNSFGNIFFGENNKIFISMISSTNKSYELFFYDATGKKLRNEIINISIGNNMKLLNPEKLATGIYMIVLQNEDEVITKKLFFK